MCPILSQREERVWSWGLTCCSLYTPLPTFVTAGAAELTDGICLVLLWALFLLALQLSGSDIVSQREDFRHRALDFCQFKKSSCQVSLDEGYFEVLVPILISGLECEHAEYRFVLSGPPTHQELGGIHKCREHCQI